MPKRTVNSDSQIFRLLHKFNYIGLANRFIWSRSGRFIAIATNDGTVQVEEITGIQRRFVAADYRNGNIAVAFSADEEWILIGGYVGIIQVYNIQEGYLAYEFTGHNYGSIRVIEVSPDGKYIFSSGEHGGVIVWDFKSGEIVHEFRHPNSATVKAIEIDRLGKFVITASQSHIAVWDMYNFGEQFRVDPHSYPIKFLQLSSDGKVFVACSDQGITLWNIEERREIGNLQIRDGKINSLAIDDTYNIAFAIDTGAIGLLSSDQSASLLEAHQSSVLGVSFSADSRFLVSKSSDNTLRLWLKGDWTNLDTITEGGTLLQGGSAVMFHPKEPEILASVNRRAKSVQIWQIDAIALNHFIPLPKEKPVYYTTAKIALVGDSGVGKSALGHRIAEGDFYPTASTHGQHFWVIKEIGVAREDGTECEAILWDFAGQPDYRLIHALFLDDIDLALLLFDASNLTDPLRGIEYWLKQLSQQEQEVRKILVATRSDRGTPLLTSADLEAFCTKNDIQGGFIVTSALTNYGIAALIERIKAQINWDSMTATITTKTFREIKEFVLSLKEIPTKPQIILTWDDLFNHVQEYNPSSNWDYTENDIKAAVRHMQSHGYITLLRGLEGEETILLHPEILINLTASIVLEARRNHKGLGSLDEIQLLRGGFTFPELQQLNDYERDILLHAAVAMFVKNHICWREQLSNQIILVFPSLINQKRPSNDEYKVIERTSYLVSGAIEHVYPSLVVLLGYVNMFQRSHQWQNQAQYIVGDNEICGFRQIFEREGEVELVLYLGERTPEYTYTMFEGMFERFLRQKDVKVVKYPPIVCQKCTTLQERKTVIDRINHGKRVMFCSECGHQIVLPEFAGGITLSEPQRKKIEHEERIASLRTAYSERLTFIKIYTENKAIKSPSCFISYAWGVKEHELWVSQLASDLKEAGVEVIYDKWHAAPIGTNLPRFMSQSDACDFVIVVGTPEYREKYNNDGLATGVAVEGDLSNLRLTDSEARKQTVLPLLLAGDATISLPPLLRGRTYADFRNPIYYFTTLFDLLLTVYKLPFDQPHIDQLRQELQLVLETMEI